MSVRAVTFAMLLTTGLACAVSAQTKHILISDIPRDQRESVTLSRKDAHQTDCRITYVAGSPGFAIYVVQDKMQQLLNSEKSTSADKYILFSVAVDSAAMVSSRVIETNMKSDQVNRISKLIQDAVVGRRDTMPITFRLRLDPGDANEPMRVGPSVTCAPRWTNEIKVERELGAAVRGKTQEIFGGETRLGMTASLLVDEQGSPLSGAVVTPSASPMFDKAVVTTLLKFAKFEPGTIDGKPSSLPVEMPVKMALGRGLGH